MQKPVCGEGFFKWNLHTLLGTEKLARFAAHVTLILHHYQADGRNAGKEN